MMECIKIKIYQKSSTASFAQVSWIVFECSFSDFQFITHDNSGQFDNVLIDFLNNDFWFQMHNGVELHAPL